MHQVTIADLLCAVKYREVGTIPALLNAIIPFTGAAPAYSTVVNAIADRGYYVRVLEDSELKPLLVTIIPAPGLAKGISNV
jgi:hypothetical protein